MYIGIAGGAADTVDLNVFVFPLQWMLWIGGVVVAAGGTLALLRKPLARRGTSEVMTTADTGSDG